MGSIKLTFHCYSEALCRPVEISAMIPDTVMGSRLPKDTQYRSLYVLGGAMGGSDDIFTQMDLLAYMNEKKYDNVAVFGFAPSFGFYTDYVKDYRYGHKYYTFVTKELIQITRTLFPLSEKIEDTAIYGCSMGGWGAFFCGLNNPDLYGYVGAQSGMVDMQWAIDVRPFMHIKHQRQFGDDLNIKDTRNDLYHVLEELDKRAAKKELSVPKIYQSWGDKDYLIEPNEKMNSYIKTLEHLDYTAIKIPGIHGWGTNAVGVHNFMDWMMNGGKEEKKSYGHSDENK